MNTEMLTTIIVLQAAYITILQFWLGWYAFRNRRAGKRKTNQLN